MICLMTLADYVSRLCQHSSPLKSYKLGKIIPLLFNIKLIILNSKPKIYAYENLPKQQLYQILDEGLQYYNPFIQLEEHQGTNRNKKVRDSRQTTKPDDLPLTGTDNKYNNKTLVPKLWGRLWLWILNKLIGIVHMYSSPPFYLIQNYILCHLLN